MDINSSIDTLFDKFGTKDWFFTIDTDEFNRIVMYVKYMCHETLHDIPNSINYHPILVHFAKSYALDKEQFIHQEKDLTPSQVSVVEEISFPTVNLHYLLSELDRLEKICGSNLLQDIFYEVHDGKNAVTNYGSKFPEVKNAIQVLYHTYGFDAIYEEIDG
jgi:hypothetical protein